MNNSETDISGQNPTLAQYFAAFPSSNQALERLASPKKKSEWRRRDVWEVDLRPHDKRKYFSPKDRALEEAQIQRTRFRNEGLEGLEFTLDQRTDSKMAMAVLAGSGLSLTQVAKIAMEFHGPRSSP